MLPITQNSDHQHLPNNISIINPYIDLHPEDITNDGFGVVAIDTAIENILCTMPGERLFNIGFCSPLYKILFENYTIGIEQQIFDKIESILPIAVQRNSARIEYDNHCLVISIPYVTHDGLISSIFTRRIRK